MATFLLGKDAVLYFGTAATTPPALAAMTAVSNVMDLTVNGDADAADITTRGNAGWKATAPTLRNMDLSFKMLWKPGDAFFIALLAAWQASGVVHIAAIDQAYTVTGAQGPKGDFCVTGFTKGEPLAEGQVVDVKLSLSAFTEWYVKAA